MIYIQPIYKVQICYKSGQSVTQEYTSFKYVRNATGIETVDYKTASAFKSPMFINLDEIESIWQTGTRFSLRFGRKPK